MPKRPSLAGDLAAWYAAVARDLPWRRSRDPYAIWISEVMLQQTQVATVIPYFERWMASFPTVQALAAAPEDTVLKRWEGLGYYSRARHLHAAAKMVVEHHAGVMPQTYEAVRRLPGIGDYTAGAILSIAFEQPVAAVDGNVLRVFSRLALSREDVSRPATKKAIAAVIAGWLAEKGVSPGTFNQALMELGATVCTPTKPTCDTCPVQRHCRGFAAGEAESLPIKTGQRPPKALVLAAVLIARNGKWLLVKRPAPGIWGGLWALPAVEMPLENPERPDVAAESLVAAFSAIGLQLEPGPLLTTVRHTLTHRALTIPVFAARLKAALPDREANPLVSGIAWIERHEVAQYALPVPFRKALASIDLGPLFQVVTGE